MSREHDRDEAKRLLAAGMAEYEKGGDAPLNRLQERIMRAAARKATKDLKRKERTKPK